MYIINKVILSKAVIKALRKLPRHIIEKLSIWVEDVSDVGLDEVRKRPGYHDEPLWGRRFGQRSIRLSLSYRAIYIIKDDGRFEFIEVTEVHKHDY